MNKKAWISSAAVILLTIIIVVVIFGGCYYLIKSTNTENLYNTSEEALNAEFSGDILNDLDFCGISIVGNKTGTLLQHFSFIDVEQKQKYDCDGIKQDCDLNPNCFWVVNRQASQDGSNKYWRVEFTGTCVCKLES